MQPCLFAALFALRAAAAPQLSSELGSVLPSGVVTVGGVELDTDFITEPIFEILNYSDGLLGQTQTALAARQGPAQFATMTAEAVAALLLPGAGKPGVLYRGDSRDPETVFRDGFAPQGTDQSLMNHLNFRGNSGLVSLSRSPEAAAKYAFGRTGERSQTGYVYAVAPVDVPDGYWVPGLFPAASNHAVHHNKEFAAIGAVPGASVAHAYQLGAGEPWHRKGRKHLNLNYKLHRGPRCPIMKRQEAAQCDPVHDEDHVPGGPRIGTVDKSFRASLQGNGLFDEGGVFGSLSPHARDVLGLLKTWDNPIGRAVNWFDGTKTWLEGQADRVPEIIGDDAALKLRFVCWVRGRGAPRTSRDAVDTACDRLYQGNHYTANTPHQRKLGGINTVLKACETLADLTTVLPSEELRTEVLDRCFRLRELVNTLETFGL